MSKLSAHDEAILNCVFQPNLPLTDPQTEEPKDNEEESVETIITKKMEVDAIAIAETGELQKALDLLNEALKIAPKRASLYNNRAQVYQYKREFEDAFLDLSKAIELAEIGQKRTLSQAYCQRGLLNRRAGRLDQSRADFESAAQLGNQFARSQLVELNPYAALCNQMLKKVMDTL